jgi:hypothetical protein
MPPAICPHCGEEIPPRAKACPQCGSDEETGWSEEARSDGLGLPEENFNYDEFVQREFGDKSPKPRGLNWFWWLVALLLLVAFVLVYLR